jgi:hypothetical protein
MYPAEFVTGKAKNKRRMMCSGNQSTMGPENTRPGNIEVVFSMREQCTLNESDKRLTNFDNGGIIYEFRCGMEMAISMIVNG